MKKILAIDDQKDNLVTIAAVLQSQLKDIEIITAISGREGIEKAKTQQPDTIILDVIMPLMDGFETCRLLKEDELTKHIPIIMLTAIRTDVDSRVKGLLLGADAFLPKPIDPIELSAQTKVLLRIKEAEDKLKSEKNILEDRILERTHSLMESQQKYQALYENAPLSYQSLNEDGTFRDINPNWLKSLGYTKEEVIGTYFGDYLHADYKSIFPARFDKFKKLGTVSGVDFKIKHKNGHYLDIEFEGCIGYNQDGSFKQTYCVFQDVTESKRTQSELLASEEYFRTLIENSNDYISIIDTSGKIIRSSESEGDILGYNPQSLVGANIFKYVHSDDVDSLRSYFNNIDSDVTNITMVGFRFLNKDQNWRFVEGSGRNMLDHPKIKGIVFNYRDITTLKLVENAKIESDRKLNTLINNLQGIAYRCKNDEHWTMEYLSAGFENITGYKTNEIIENIQKSYNELIHPEDQDYVFQEVGKAVQNNTSFEVQYRLINARGEIIHVLDKGVGIHKTKDNVGHIEGFITDISQDKKAEEEITKLSSAVKQSPSVFVITDNMGIIEYVNPKFTESTGYTYEEAIGNKTNILKSGEQSQSIYNKLWETIKEGKIWKGEFHNKRKDGSLFWEAAAISPILDKKGEIVNFIKVAEDITEQKKAEKALIESEHKYEKLIETSSQGFWLIDKAGFTKEINNALCNIIGYSKDEMLGRRPQDFVDDDNKHIFTEQILSKNNNLQRNYNIELLSKSGKNISCQFSATLITDKSGDFNGSFAFVTDISENKRSELIQKVVYNISNAITTTDDLNTLIQQIQTSISEIIDAKNFFIALYDDKTDTLSLPFISDEKDNIVSMPAGKSLTNYVIKTKKSLLANWKTKDELELLGEIEQIGTRSKVWLGVPLKIEEKVIGVLVVQSYSDENAFNLSDLKMMEFVSNQVSISIMRKKSEQDTIDALEKATESDRLKNAFLQNISHEIRTPMNGIMGFTSLLKDSTLSGEEQQSYLDVIMVSGNRMLNTLNDLMDISMLETGQVKLNICETDINNEFLNLYDFFKLEVETKGMEIESEILLSSDKMRILTDQAKFYAILSNLIKNSIKYSTQGKIKFGCEKKGDFIEFYVKDNGIGIPKQRLKAIFDRFVQADIEDVKVYEGSGLGLSISKAYIELMGGSIWAESTEGKGSQFYFTLPYNPIEVIIETKEVKNEIGDENRNIKILVAEDEEFAREFLGIILNKPDITLIYAIDGVEAVEKSRENPDLDLILMDIKLPKMDGYAATKSIREFNKKVPIIAQTAYALAGDREKAIKAGCNDHITKPINSDNLLNMINELIVNKTITN